MKYFAPIFLFFCCHSLSAQLISGDLVEENRKLLTETNFKVDGSQSGVLFYELSVNREGEVTGERLLFKQSTVTSTPTRFLARKHLKQLHFQPGTYYPKFHHVVVKITTVKKQINDSIELEL